jgi:hypothetical protein
MQLLRGSESSVKARCLGAAVMCRSQCRRRALWDADSAEYAMPAFLQDQGSELQGLPDLVRQTGSVRRLVCKTWQAKGKQMVTPNQKSHLVARTLPQLTSIVRLHLRPLKDDASCASRRASTPVLVDARCSSRTTKVCRSGC